MFPSYLFGFVVTPYAILTAISACLAMIVAAIAWPRRSVSGGTSLALLMMAIAEWSLGAAIEYATISTTGKIFWSKIEYIGTLSSPVFFLFFALERNRLERWITKRNVALLFIIPVVTFLLAATNEWHLLVWSSFTPSAGNLLIYGHGWWWWIGSLGYSYVLLFAGTILLFRAVIHFQGEYSHQNVMVLAGAIVPWLGNMVYAFGFSPRPGLDITNLLMMLSGVILALGIFRFRLLDLIPVARDALVETMSDGMLVLDGENRIVDINQAAKRLFNSGKEIRSGQPINDLCTDFPDLAALIQNTTEERFEVAPSGSTHGFLEFTVSRVHDPRGRFSGWLVTVRDISQKKQTEIALQHHDAILQAVSLAAEKFLGGATWEESVPEVLAQLGAAADISRVYVFERHLAADDTPLVSQRYEWVAKGITAQIDSPDLQNLPYQAAGFERWEAAFLQRQSIAGLVRDFPVSERQLLSAQDILAITLMPIFDEERLWGFIGFDECRFERVWTTGELEALQTAAGIFGAALSRKRAEAILHDRQRSLNLLHDIIHKALQTPDLNSMAQTLVDRVGQLIGADGCFLTQWDEATRRVIPLAAYGPFRDTYSETTSQPGEKTFTASVLDAGHPLPIEDTHKSPYVSPHIVAQFPSRSMLALPLIVGGSKLGAILLSFNNSHHFSDDEIANGEQAADLIALTLAKFQAMEQANQRAEEAETLRKASAVVAATLDPQEAVSRILDQLEQVVPYDSASVQLLRDGELEVVGGRGWDDPSKVIGLRFSIPGENPNSVVIRTRQPYVLNEAEKAYPTFHQPPHSHIRSWLGVPLIVHNQVTGLLAIDSREPDHFTNGHIQMAAAFADQVAIALENANLFGSTQWQVKRQEALLQLSAELAMPLPEQEICRRAVNRLQETLKFDYVGVVLVEAESGDRVVQAATSFPNQKLPTRFPAGKGLSELPLLDGQIHYTPDVTKEARYVPGIHGSEVDAPILIGDKVRGTLVIEATRPHAFSDHNRAVINTAANLLGLALTRAELFAREHRQFEELAVLHAIALATTEARNEDELLERTTQLIGEKLFPDNFGILLLDEKTKLLHLHTSYRLGINAEDFSIPLGQGITGVVAKSGQARRVPDVSKDPDYINVDSRIRSETCVPLKIGGQVIGVINAESTALAAFTPDDERLLATLANQLAIGIERLRAVDKIYQQAATLAQANALISALAQVAARIETESDPNGIFRTLGEELKKLGLTCLVSLFMPGTSELNIRYTSLDERRTRIIERITHRGIKEFHFPVEKLARYVDLTHQPHATILRDPIAILTNILEGFTREAIERILAPGMTKDAAIGHFPLLVEERVLGFLWLWGENLEETDLPSMSIFANQVAIAIENARLFAEVQNLAVMDPLTGLYNRRGLFGLGRLEFARTRRFGRPFASLMLDIDHFRRVNNTYGHPVGDQVLQALARHCQNSVREIDLVGRYGGEEFIFLLPETDLSIAREIAERLRKTIAETKVPTDKGEISVTVSIGVAVYDDFTLDLETMIARADQAMYVSKHKGRNRVSVSR
jgi:diguanylate cyclase (GGDEF)-like protein/PAS domain S-box-containing protein